MTFFGFWIFPETARQVAAECDSVNGVNPFSSAKIRFGAGEIQVLSGEIRKVAGEIRIGAEINQFSSAQSRIITEEIRIAAGEIRIGSGENGNSLEEIRIGAEEIRQAAGEIRKMAGGNRIGSREIRKTAVAIVIVPEETGVSPAVRQINRENRLKSTDVVWIPVYRSGEEAQVMGTERESSSKSPPATRGAPQRERFHSALTYKSPVDFETQLN